MESHIATNRPRITPVKEIQPETLDTKTIIVQDINCSRATPGQFAMIWVPGVGEVPMSLSFMDRKLFCGFTVKALGPTSSCLCSLKEGDLIGIRGPYGNGYSTICGNCLIVGGGTGVAPLIPLVSALMEKGSTISLLLAGKSKGELLFLNYVEKMLSGSSNRLYIATDDGSYGIKSIASDYVAELLECNRYNMIYTCGPELMMKKILVLANQNAIPVQASLERYIKCGFGICGSCAIGNYLVCIDGPVFTSKQLGDVSLEFGFSCRDSSGRKIPIKK